MYETSPYSTPILWSALVAGPLNGEVVASWRNTSRNDFSCGVSIFISRPVFHLPMTVRAFFVWGHRRGRLPFACNALILHSRLSDATFGAISKRDRRLTRSAIRGSPGRSGRIPGAAVATADGGVAAGRWPRRACRSRCYNAEGWWIVQGGCHANPLALFRPATPTEIPGIAAVLSRGGARPTAGRPPRLLRARRGPRTAGRPGAGRAVPTAGPGGAGLRNLPAVAGLRRAASLLPSGRRYLRDLLSLRTGMGTFSSAAG